MGMIYRGKNGKMKGQREKYGSESAKRSDTALSPYRCIVYFPFFPSNTKKH
jgi:hypothetical protein